MRNISKLKIDNVPKAIKNSIVMIAIAWNVSILIIPNAPKRVNAKAKKPAKMHVHITTIPRYLSR